MKVTVCFGKTAIVVPCKDGKFSVRELIQQAAQRYIKAKEKEPGYWVKIRHLEYKDGGILDPDDIVADVVEDKDKLIAVFDEHDVSSKKEDGITITDRLSPDPFEAELEAHNATYHPLRGEIEVTPSALKLGTPLLVRRSSDPTMGPVPDFHPGSSHTADQSMKVTVQGPTSISTDGQKELSWQGDHMKSQKARFMFSALGLYIRGIEENSRTKQEGLFQENECIVKINSVELADRSFTQAQDIFRQAMKHPSVLVEVVPSHNRELYEKSAITCLPLLEDEDDDVPNIKPPPPPTHTKLSGKISDHINGLDSALSLPSSVSPDPTRDGSSYSSPLGFGTKKIAKILRIDLKKGADGLGFTVVTRDSTVHGPGPIFVKNILPKGAAIKDGRLLSGDRIAEVNGIAIAGKTQEELVAMLRSTKLGETVSLVVARQEEAFLPRELREVEGHVVSPENTVQMTFEVPLNDSGSAGLGVSLKGNKSRDTSSDLGIFIKSIIHGGAAFKDGRLRVNDKLLAVNGESLLSKTNQEAMETLRRSMSMEGNIRGMIQLVIQRKLERQTEDQSEPGTVLKFIQENISDQNGFRFKKKDSDNDEENFDKDVPYLDYSKFSPAAESSQQPDASYLKASKSMDLVPNESKLASLNMIKSDFPGKDLGPRLGLKKSSSLESLQTAVAEVKKNDLPFYRPRPHMVRGRGCNESFRAAIDKSYDGPEDEEDGLSDVSSHSSQAAPIENAQLEDTDKLNKDKKKKDKKKDKEKDKAKVKEKKKEEADDHEKKAKKKGFGAILRFGKKNKDDKGGKVDQKGSPKTARKEEEHDVEKMKEERDRINSKHQEIREKQAKVLFDLNASHAMEDDDMDPNYAKINHFKEAPHGHSSQRPYSPTVPRAYSYTRDPLAPASERDQVQDIYATINKKQQAQEMDDSGRLKSGNADRIQQLRMEYQQAKREGFYEMDNVAGQALEYEQTWVPARGPGGTRNLSYEGMERQYASLPRPGPVDTVEYMAGPRAMYMERDPPYYYDVAASNTRGTYSRSKVHQEDNYRYPPYQAPLAKSPLRQDVPPSPPQGPQIPGYGTGGRSGQDRYQYRSQDPKHKNATTAAV
ncbi:partitioning defective 3 homolog B isoform X2 [Rana temporaria]|uniref:partitioning defective 3 homolog B isoform X2 n=1 Tax=Rana temporaria TaxID=8407 RepID=UPI001AAE0EE5|nr:partitioning defective 3 homolog B isoform X2 [Rana temporaria]